MPDNVYICLAPKGTALEVRDAGDCLTIKKYAAFDSWRAGDTYPGPALDYDSTCTRTVNLVRAWLDGKEMP